MTILKEVPGPAWFSHHINTNQKFRFWLRGWFTPLHGFVYEVAGPAIRVGVLGQEKWVTVSGKKRDVQKVELL